MKLNEQRKNILEPLKDKYPQMINPELLSLIICQDEESVYLEKVFKSNPEKIHREAMDFIADDDFIQLEPIISAQIFHPDRSLKDNIERFLHELEPSTIDYCFDDIFTEEASRKITKDLK